MNRCSCDTSAALYPNELHIVTECVRTDQYKWFIDEVKSLKWAPGLDVGHFVCGSNSEFCRCCKVKEIVNTILKPVGKVGKK